MMRERGIHALEKQLDTVPEDVRARMLLAGYYAAVGRREDGVRQLQTAVALRPRDSTFSIMPPALTLCSSSPAKRSRC